MTDASSDGIPAVLLAALPREARSAFTRAFPAEPATAAWLRNRLSVQGADVEDAARERDVVDSSLADSIALRLDKALAGYGAMTRLQQSVLHAAVEYFVLEHDGEADLDSNHGFEDDAAVANACLHWLGLDALLVPRR
ncbi:MAG: hypothetical protein KBB21_37175 [Nannocystaceae bacterium]|nr:hypothetical protein [Deltaproteobacteria bacterium]MBP7292320.1 hypothetical protein [Nannocystaceae bacterium]